MAAFTTEQMLEQAKLYGYHVNMSSGDRTVFGLHHDRYPIHLDLYVKTNEFSLTHIEGIIQMTTGKCGSFMNEVHFLKIQRHLIDILLRLGGR